MKERKIKSKAVFLCTAQSHLQTLFSSPWTEALILRVCCCIHIWRLWACIMLINHSSHCSVYTCLNWTLKNLHQWIRPGSQVCSPPSRLMGSVLLYPRHRYLRWSCSIRCLLYLFHVPSQTPERKCQESRSQSRGVIWVMLRDGIVPYSLGKVVKRAERLLPTVGACRSAAHRWNVFLLFPFLLLWFFSVRFRILLFTAVSLLKIKLPDGGFHSSAKRTISGSLKTLSVMLRVF